MNSDKKAPALSQQRFRNIFKKNFFEEVVFITDLPSKKLCITFKNDIEIDIGSNSNHSKEDALFYPFFIQTKSRSFIVIASSFSLYDSTSREPYLESKAEFSFQKKLKSAFCLSGGYTYGIPGNSSDFVMTDLSESDVLDQDMELRYENDGEFFYLFVLI